MHACFFFRTHEPGSTAQTHKDLSNSLLKMEANWLVASNKKVQEALDQRDSDVTGHEQQEKRGYISKKSTKGFYQSRFFATNGRRLAYWADEAAYLEEKALLASDKADHSKHVTSATVYDIVAMRVVEMAPERVLHCKFSNDKFKLDLQFRSDTERSEWTTLMLAKKNLHSVQELRRAVAEQHVVILTPTFQNLLRLEEEDQDTWMVERIEDLFEEAEASAQEGESECVSGLRRARCAIDELLLLCEDCELELGSRNPRVGVHCKAYVQRFALAVKGRCLLELQALLMSDWDDDESGSSGGGMGSEGLCRRLAALGTQSLCEAISLMGRVERLKRYHFMPTGFVHSIHTNLFSMGELISAYLNLAIDRVEAWFRNTLMLAPQQRGQRFSEFFEVVLAEVLCNAELDARDGSLQDELLQRLTITALLTFSDQIALVRCESWGQQCVLHFVESLQTTLLTIDSRKVQWEQNMKNGNRPGSFPNQQKTKGRRCSLVIPVHAAEAVRISCYEAASTATNSLADDFENSLTVFSAPLFKLKLAENWEGDQCIAILVSHIGGWGTHLKAAMPSFLARQIQRRCASMAVKVYINEIAQAYKSNHKGFSLLKQGLMQVGRDFAALQRFVISMSGGELDSLPELEILLHLQTALTAPVEPAEAFTAIFWPALVKFGLPFGHILYDLYRLILKIRGDVGKVPRKVALGTCAAMVNALQLATATDSLVLGAWGGTHEADRVHILQRLCPRVLHEHCTGSKWTVEKAPDDPASQLRLQQFVMEAMEAARCRHEELLAVERKVLLSARTTVRRVEGAAGGEEEHPPSLSRAGSEFIGEEEEAEIQRKQEDRRSIGRVLRQRSAAGGESPNTGDCSPMERNSDKWNGKGSFSSSKSFSVSPLYPPPPAPALAPLDLPTAFPPAVPVVTKKNKVVHRRTDSEPATPCATPVEADVAALAAVPASSPAAAVAPAPAPAKANMGEASEDEDDDADYADDFESDSSSTSDDLPEDSISTDPTLVDVTWTQVGRVEDIAVPAPQAPQIPHPTDPALILTTDLETPVGSVWVRRSNEQSRPYWQNSTTRQKTFVKPYGAAAPAVMEKSVKSESSMVLATAMRAGGRISVRRSLQPPPPPPQQKQQQVSSLEPPKEAEEEAVGPPPTYAELQRTPGTPPPPAYAQLQVDAALEQAALSPSAVPTPNFPVSPKSSPNFPVSPKSSPALVPAELQQVQLAIDELHDEAVAAASPKPQKKPPKPKKPVRSPPGGLAATYPAPSSSSSSTGSDASSGLLSNTMSSPSSSADGSSPSSRPKVLSARTESFHKLLLTAQQNLAAARKATEE